MTDDKEERSRINIVAVLAVGFTLAAHSANDPFLLLNSPCFVSNKVQLTIVGETGANYIIERSGDFVNWIAVATNGCTNMTCVLTFDSPSDAAFFRAWRKDLPVFSGALTAKTRIDCYGNAIRVDSFDSGDPIKSTECVYDISKRCDRGDLSSFNVNVGNADINGKVTIGTDGSCLIGNAGSIGPIDWTSPGTNAPGWVRKDFRFVLPDVSPPYTSGNPPILVGTNGFEVATGDYCFSGDFTDSALKISGDARLYVTGNFRPNSIRIESGASLQLYVAGGTASIPQVDVLDRSATALTFQYYGLNSNTNVSWGSGTSYVATVYAPAAQVSVDAAGLVDFHGACVARFIRLFGFVRFHYDEALQRDGPKR